MRQAPNRTHSCGAERRPAVKETITATARREKRMRKGGAWYGGGLSSAGLAHTFAPTGGTHGAAPNTLRRLERGDLVRLDIYGSLDGYVFDFARSFVVGRRPTPEQAVLLNAVRDSVQAGIDALRPGVTLGAVAQSCEAALSRSEYVRHQGMPESVMGGAWGHGLGLAFEPPWITSDSDVIVQPGMCFAVERRIEAASRPAAARGAQYEDNILITLDGAELLTPAPPF
jgi:Xaa-Pro aminopeptidase